jgi:uncharacterized damage-inducible protein DinB
VAGLLPAVTDERSGLLAFLDAQRQALRWSVHGLTEFQSRQVASVSTLSLATLLHHVTRVEQRWTVVALAGRTVPEIWPVTDWGADFRVSTDVRLATLLETYADTAQETERIVAEFEDLGEPCRQPESAELSVRWILLHLIEETARHAGHADIIRESIDGASAAMLRRPGEA